MAKTVRARAIKNQNKLPYKQFRFTLGDTATDADMRAGAAANVQSDVYEGEALDSFEIEEVPAEELVPGTINDAATTAGSAGTHSAKLRYITATLGTILTNFSSLLTNSASLLTNSTSLLTNSASLLTSFTSLLANFATLLANLPTTLSLGGNLKVSLEETKTGTDSVTIQGTAANGAPVSGNPLQIGGRDGSGNAQTVLTGIDGSLRHEYTTGVTPTEIVSGTADDGITFPATPGLRLFGYTAKEDTGSGSAVINLRNGDADDDPLAETIPLSSNGIEKRWFGDKGIDMSDGIFIERVSGTSTLILYTGVI